MSRAACNIAAVLLSEELKAQGIAVVMLHPGFNKTDMTAKVNPYPYPYPQPHPPPTPPPTHTHTSVFTSYSSRRSASPEQLTE